MDKLPNFLIYWFIKKNIKKLRDGMGGKSKDFTTRKIVITDKKIMGYQEEIKIRIYKPETDENRPLVMFYHGGGFFGGSLGAVDEFCKAVSDHGNSVVVSVEYHLAPEYKYPIGIEDSYEAIKWCRKNVTELNIDLDRISVAGDSAGANFSAVLALMANDRKEFTIHKQILLYPVVDSSQYKGSKGGMNIAMLKLYMKKLTMTKHPYISPLLYEDHKGLPDALIACGEYDFLYENSEQYATVLSDADVSVKHITYKNAFHAFIDNTGNDKNANDLVLEVSNFINEKE